VKTGNQEEFQQKSGWIAPSGTFILFFTVLIGLPPAPTDFILNPWNFSQFYTLTLALGTAFVYRLNSRQLNNILHRRILESTIFQQIEQSDDYQRNQSGVLHKENQNKFSPKVFY
jgi:hypothetical protein